MNQITPSMEQAQGFFSPHEPYWQVNREWLVILSGARAVLLELAHPLVAAGVADYSNFRRDPLGRLFRTVRMMIDATFGNAETARRAFGRVHRCHGHVHGVLAEDAGSLPAGTDYQANDPHLKMWVLATLVDSILLVHDLFVRPLSWAEKESYYRDSQRLGYFLGIPKSAMPATYHDFTTYVAAMIAAEELTVSNTAQEVAKALFAPPLLGPLLRTASFAGIGLLPSRLRDEFDFAWDEKQERRLHWLAQVSRRVRPLLPDLLCVQPEALLAEWRHRKLETRNLEVRNSNPGG